MSNIYDQNECFIMKGDYLNLNDCEYYGKILFPRTKADCVEGLSQAILNSISGLSSLININGGNGVNVSKNAYSDRIEYTVESNIGYGLKFDNGKIMLDVGDGFSFEGNKLKYTSPSFILTGEKID